MSRGPAVELAPGVYRIPTAPADLVNTFAVVSDDDQVTLVDCGTRWAPGGILARLRSVGLGPSDITRIVLTHAHPDHAGGLSHISARTGAPVAVHARDADHVRGGRSPAHDPRAGRIVRHLAPRRFAPVDVAEELHDDQVLPGGLRVLHTPGHTPGHICLLHEPSGVLIVGDALMHIRRLRWPPTVLCTDGAQARQAAERLAGLDFEVAAFSHGRELRDHARESVRGFLHAREERR